jgi:4,5-DOPA dioxygenase extradiol
MSTASLPALFVSHGAPLFATDPGTTGPALQAWAAAHAPAAQLKGIVIMSPHWMTRGPAVMGAAAPTTWHDFGGFPPELYQLQYPAPGSPALAAQVADLLAVAGIKAPLDPERPFDHGAWVPLMHMYPQADVPVVQVALPQGWGPAQVLALGRALQPLREQGVLVVGSGSMTHNLRDFFGGDRAASPYVSAFARWIEDAVTRGDVPALLDYAAQAPEALRAHPSDDHFLPLFFALGAAGDSFKADYISREVRYGMLAMDAVALQ